MNIKVICDSTGDISPEFQKKYNIDIVPLIVVKDGKEYIDGETIVPADIFEHVAKGGELCSTAARSVLVYQEMFAKHAPHYDGVIHVNIGAEFSSSYQNACIAAEEFDNVRVIDSRNLTVGQAFVAFKALEYAKETQDLDELKARLDAFTDKIETSFVLDRLDYMVKGGRCSSTAALGANLLHLKPCLDLKNGKLTVGKKYRGTYEKCMVSYVKDKLANRTDIDTSLVYIDYTDVSEDVKEAVRAAVSQCQSFAEIRESVAGCTISCHCGPGTMGVIFCRK